MRFGMAVAAAATLLLLAGGCSSSSTSTSPTPPPTNANIYYDYFNGGTPQAAVVPYPLTNTSTPAIINGNGTNLLLEANSMLFDASGRLWIFTNPGACCATNVVTVFALPFTQASAPLFTLTLSGSNNLIGAAFDPSGNVWAVSQTTASVLEYTGPFTATATISPSLTLTNGLNTPTAIAFDATGDLFVTNFGSAGANSVTRFNAPITNLMTASAQLAGITKPAGIVFDKSGNLYVGSTGSAGSTGPIFRYNSGNQANGAVPDITDSTGLLINNYASTLVFDNAGNLYDGDCGNTAKIYVFPTATSAFSATLAPSVVFSEANIVSIDCVWGLAVR